MHKISRPLLVLHEDPLLRERLRSIAAAQAMDLERLTSWDELHGLVRVAPASAIIVVDPYLANAGGGPSLELASLLNRFPSLTIAAAVEARAGRSDDVLKLGEWGVVQVIDLEEETTAIAMGRRLMAARGRPLRALIERQLPAYTSATARAILNAAVAIVADGGQGADLAKTLHITVRTLTRWCRRAGLPPPKRLLAWMRLLLAAEFLDDAGRPVSAVALACGYAADSSLRLALRHFTALSPTELREMGSFETAAACFVEALEEARSPNTRYRARSTSKPSGRVLAPRASPTLPSA